MPKITEDLLRRTCLGERDEVLLRDTQMTGFAARLRKRADNQRRVDFYLIQELPRDADGRRRRRKITIGTHPAWSVDKARDEAARMLRDLDKGLDPKAQRQELREAPVFEDLVAAFREVHYPRLRPRTIKDYDARIERVLAPAFAGKRVADITREDCKRLLNRYTSKPVEGNRSLAILSKMLAEAIDMNMISDNPARGLRKLPEKAKDKWLDEHDLPKFYAALRGYNGTERDAIEFLLWTGWRIGEMTGLRWDMVDLERNLARLPTTKTGAQVRHLNDDATRLIEQQPHRMGYVFSRRGGGRPIDYQSVRLGIRTICDRAGIDRITPHDLRHTAATWAAVNGAEAHELRETFGWSTLAMTSRYVSRASALAKRGTNRVADAIRQATKEQADG